MFSPLYLVNVNETVFSFGAALYRFIWVKSFIYTYTHSPQSVLSDILFWTSQRCPPWLYCRLMMCLCCREDVWDAITHLLFELLLHSDAELELYLRGAASNPRHDNTFVASESEHLFMSQFDWCFPTGAPFTEGFPWCLYLIGIHSVPGGGVAWGWGWGWGGCEFPANRPWRQGAQTVALALSLHIQA